MENTKQWQRESLKLKVSISCECTFKSGIPDGSFQCFYPISSFIWVCTIQQQTLRLTVNLWNKKVLFVVFYCIRTMLNNLGQSTNKSMYLPIFWYFSVWIYLKKYKFANLPWTFPLRLTSVHCPGHAPQNNVSGVVHNNSCRNCFHCPTTLVYRR